MTLKSGQSIIQIATLYNANVSNAIPLQLQASIEATGGTINLWGSQTKPASPTTGMTKLLSAVTGLNAIPLAPNYLYVEQASGTTTQLIISGIDATTPAV